MFRKRVSFHCISRAEIILIMAMGGAAAALFVTGKHGAGVCPDSVQFLAAAKGLSEGKGLIADSGNGFNRWPPLFPSLLALPSILSIEPLQTARFLNAALFGGTILLVGLTLIRYLPSAFWTPILGTTLIATSPFMLYIHSMVWTEPLFIFLGFMGIFLLAKYLDKSSPVSLLAAAGTFGLACMTRYAGPSFIACGVISIVFLSKQRARARFRNAGILLAVACMPLGFWVFRNILLTGSSTGRRLRFHPIGFAHLENGIIDAAQWLFPWPLPVVAALIIILAGMAAFAFICHNLRRVAQPQCKAGEPHEMGQLPFILGIFLTCYLGFLAVSISFFDAATPLDFRILSPVFVAGVMLFLCVAARIQPSPISIRVIPWMVVVLYFCSSIIWVARARNEGLAFCASSYRCSAIIKSILSLPSDMAVFTNEPCALRFYTSRPIEALPLRLLPEHRIINPDGNTDLANCRKIMEQKPSILVYFRSYKRYSVPEEELVQYLQLHCIAEENSVAAYVMATSVQQH